MINSSLYLLPRLGVAWPVCDRTETHDAIQCDVTKRSDANISVKRHPRVVKQRLRRDLRSTLAAQAGKKTSKQKNAQLPARCVGSSAGHPRCGFASILIFIQDFLRADQRLFFWGGAPEVALRLLSFLLLSAD